MFSKTTMRLAPYIVFILSSLPTVFSTPTDIDRDNSSSCRFIFGSMVLLSGSRPRTTVAAGFNTAVADYVNGYLNDNTYLNAHHCSVSANMLDMESDIKVGIVRAFEFGQSYDRNDINQSDINVPFVIGPPTSGYSLTLNPLFAAFNLLQFSSTATSTFLSHYPQFFRSVPSDDLQANALIQLCNYFGWRNIGIMYMNTNYGSSLQQALTSYANHHQVESTTFSYIDGDNITIADAVGSMKQSRIYIHILIAYGSDLEFITSQIIAHDMIRYPYYFLGTDSWLGNVKEDANQFLEVYGGVIGTCPWSPSLDDPFANKYPFPINESIQMFIDFNERWKTYYKDNTTREDLLYGNAEPGFFTGYGYDNVLTVIKSVNEYVSLYGWDVLYHNNENITRRFQDILHSLWFVGLTGNVSYDKNGDRDNGLFSFCNVDPVTGKAQTIGYVIDIINKQRNHELVIEIDESLVQWPSDYVERQVTPPQYEYTKYDGIPTALVVIVWSVCGISIVFAIFCMLCLFCYRNRPIIKSSQWRLSCVMGAGVLLAYAAIMIYGVDESLFVDWDWDLYCNIRILIFNFAFGLSFGPLFFKVYRIRSIFTVGMSLKKQELSDTKMACYNLIYVGIEFVLCLALIVIIPLHRIYVEAEQYDIEKEFYGNCEPGAFWYIYGLILIVPKLVLCVYSIIISIAVYNSVSMMKFNEGLQILITVVISVIFLFILLIILGLMTINSKSSATFYYGFLSLILLMLSNFCVVIMLMPRLVAIWRGNEEQMVEENQELQDKVHKYLMKMRRFKRQKNGSGNDEMSTTYRKSTDTPVPPTPIQATLH